MLIIREYYQKNSIDTEYKDYVYITTNTDGKQKMDGVTSLEGHVFRQWWGSKCTAED